MLEIREPWIEDQLDWIMVLDRRTILNEKEGFDYLDLYISFD